MDGDMVPMENDSEKYISTNVSRLRDTTIDVFDLMFAIAKCDGGIQPNLSGFVCPSI
jgi:hypothetical protein